MPEAIGTAQQSPGTPTKSRPEAAESQEQSPEHSRNSRPEALLSDLVDSSEVGKIDPGVCWNATWGDELEA